jgi:hypothetical protein
MENFNNPAGPFLVLVVEKDTETPERRIQDTSGLMAAATGSGNKDVLLAVALEGFARSTLSDIMTGFGSTATFEPDQIRHPIWLDVPEAENYAKLMMIVNDNDQLIQKIAAGHSDPRKPKKAVIAITTDVFIKKFLRFYFSTVAKRPETANLDEFISRGTTVILNTATHETRLLQA